MNDPVTFVLAALAADPNIAPTLARAFEKQQPRRFTNESITGFGALTMTKSTPGNLHPNDPDNVWPDDGSEDRAREEAREEDRAREAGRDPVMCSSCNGSGQGQYDGWTCWSCNGKGVLP